MMGNGENTRDTTWEVCMKTRQKSGYDRHVRRKRREKRRERRGKNQLYFYTGLVLCILLLPILCINVTVLLKGVASPNEVPKIFGIVPMVVATDSMNTDRTNIAGGDMIFAQEIEREYLQVDDIILFKQGKSLVLHRIVQVDETKTPRQFVTKGDANNAVDTSPVFEAAVLGVYKMRIPNLGRFVLFMRTGTGMTLCIGLPLILFFVYELFQKGRKAKAMEEEMQELREHVDSGVKKAPKGQENKRRVRKKRI